MCHSGQSNERKHYNVTRQFQSVCTWLQGHNAIFIIVTKLQQLAGTQGCLFVVFVSLCVSTFPSYCTQYVCFCVYVYIGKYRVSYIWHTLGHVNRKPNTEQLATHCLFIRIYLEIVFLSFIIIHGQIQPGFF